MWKKGNIRRRASKETGKWNQTKKTKRKRERAAYSYFAETETAWEKDRETKTEGQVRKRRRSQSITARAQENWVWVKLLTTTGLFLSWVLGSLSVSKIEATHMKKRKANKMRYSEAIKKGIVSSLGVKFSPLIWCLVFSKIHNIIEKERTSYPSVDAGAENNVTMKGGNNYLASACLISSAGETSWKNQGHHDDEIRSESVNDLDECQRILLSGIWSQRQDLIARP